jgi:lipoate---protein ligase
LVEWRFVDFERANAFVNMGLDEAVLISRVSGAVPNTVRLYGWSPSAVSIGRFQKLEQEVYLDKCRELGVDFVRRVSGGGTVFHDSEGEVTYCVIAKLSDLGAYDVSRVYDRVYSGVAKALRLLGVVSDFSPGDAKNCPNLTVRGRKISGSSQANRGGFVLQHGTLLLRRDLEQMFTLLRVPWAKTCMEVVGVAKNRITSLEDELGSVPPVSSVCSALRKGFEGAFGAEFLDGKLVPDEQALAVRLCREKYSTDDWNSLGKSEL